MKKMNEVKKMKCWDQTDFDIGWCKDNGLQVPICDLVMSTVKADINLGLSFCNEVC